MRTSIRKFTRSSRRVLCASLPLALLPCATACSAGSDTDSDVGFDNEPVATTDEAIINGSASSNDTVVIVRRGNGVCTGTLLRSDIVLTARHCVGTLDGQFPRHRIVTRGGVSYEISSRDQVRENQDGDMALLKLDQKVPINGRTDYWTSIHDGSLSGLRGKEVVCIGYGTNKCDGTGTTMVQRRANLKVADADTNTLKYAPNASGQIQAPGDSGGPCFLNGEVIGTVRTTACGESATQVPTTTHQEWIRDNLEDLRNDYWFEFERTSDFGYFDIIDLAGSAQGPSNWQIDTDQSGPFFGALVQSSNIHSPGSIALLKEAVIGDGSLNTFVSSESDDSASIVFRYQNSQNFYRLTAWDDESTGKSGIYKVKNGTATLLGSIPNGDLIAPMLYVYLNGSSIYGSIGGESVTVTDSDFPDGKVGLMTNGLEDGKFDDFYVDQ